MTEQQQTILAECQKTVTAIFTTKVKPIFVFHNLVHTQQVAEATREISGYYRLSGTDQFILCVAAWFHDTGYSSGHAEQHEKESARLATAFLQSFEVSAEIIDTVASCILSTQIPQRPVSNLHNIICDADLFHLGTKWFPKMTDCLRRELEAYYDREIEEDQWRRRNIDFLNTHKYFTSYCQQKLEPVKKEWLEILQNNYNKSTY